MSYHLPCPYDNVDMCPEWDEEQEGGAVGCWTKDGVCQLGYEERT